MFPGLEAKNFQQIPCMNAVQKLFQMPYEPGRSLLVGACSYKIFLCNDQPFSWRPQIGLPRSLRKNWLGGIWVGWIQSLSNRLLNIYNSIPFKDNLRSLRPPLKPYELRSHSCCIVCTEDVKQNLLDRLWFFWDAYLAEIFWSWMLVPTQKYWGWKKLKL